MSARADFVYGNTRLRARLPQLSSGPDIDPTRGHPAALEEIDRWLRSTLRGVRGLYSAAAADIVAVLSARHDLGDCLALLRGARCDQPPSRRLEAVMAVGAVDEAAAADVARSADGATAATRLAIRKLPDARTAAVLPALWERYVVNADAAQLEWSIATTAVEGWLDTLQRAGRAAAPVLALIQAECDRTNLLATLADLAAPTGLPLRLLPGRVPGETVLPAPTISAHPAWRAVLNRYLDRSESDRSLVALSDELDEVIRHDAVRGLRRGDPLGAAVPVGYVVAAEGAARAARRRVLRPARADERPDAVA